MDIQSILKNNLKFFIIMGIIIILGTLGITLALTIDNFKMIEVNTNTNTIDAEIDYENLSNTATITSTNEMLPISDSIIEKEGASIDNPKVLKAEFNVSGITSNPENTIYDVALYFNKIDCELRTEEIKWRLYKNNTLLSEGNLSPKFDIIKNNRLVLTNEQQLLTTTKDKYTFILWISENCSGDITACDPSKDQSSYLGKTINASLKIELSTKTIKKVERPTSDEFVCNPSE